FQFSFYIRHCPSKENADVHIKRVKSFIPTDGVVGLLCVTDKQFGAMELFQGKSEKNLPIGSQQLELF
ncbi:CRISPR-associated endonuclease Cas2, partial [uncultured Muribaculum sp.]